MLSEYGISAIWRLNVAAADAYRTGHPAADRALLEIAEAAEEALVADEGKKHVGA
jgi:hypothetical protein